MVSRLLGTTLGAVAGYCAVSFGTMEDDCEEEWEEAFDICADELAKPAHQRNTALTGGYNDLANCARGLVSERCGGKSSTIIASQKNE